MRVPPVVRQSNQPQFTSRRVWPAPAARCCPRRRPRAQYSSGPASRPERVLRVQPHPQVVRWLMQLLSMVRTQNRELYQSTTPPRNTRTHISGIGITSAWFLDNGEMAPTVEPPPLAPSNGADSSVPTSLLEHIHNLCDLLFNILLPKTKTVKSATISLEALHLACDLVTLACTSIHEGPQEPPLVL